MEVVVNINAKPMPDYGQCECGWQGYLNECGLDTEEDGYSMVSYRVYRCPDCDECVEVEYSGNQAELLQKWYVQRGEI